MDRPISPSGKNPSQAVNLPVNDLAEAVDEDLLGFEDVSLSEEPGSVNLKSEQPFPLEKASFKPLMKREVSKGNRWFTKARLSHIIEAINAWIRGAKTFTVKGDLMKVLFPQTRGTEKQAVVVKVDNLADAKDTDYKGDSILADALGFKKAHYVPIKGALFPADGISLADIQQGHGRHNCYFLSALAAMMAQPGGCERLQGMIKEDAATEGKTPTVTVRFPSGEAVTVDKTRLLDDSGHDAYSTGAPWVGIMEKAFHATLLMGKDNQKEHFFSGKQETGEIDRRSGIDGLLPFIKDPTMGEVSVLPNLGSSDFGSQLVELLKEGASITLGSSIGVKGAMGAVFKGLMPGHQYAVLGEATYKGKMAFVIYNPYGADTPPLSGDQPEISEGKALGVKLEGMGKGSGLFIIEADQMHRYFMEATYIKSPKVVVSSELQ